MYNRKREENKRAQQNRDQKYTHEPLKNYARERITNFQVKEPNTLLDFMLQKMGGMSKTALKSYLTKRRISVNNQIQTQFDFKLNIGDSVCLNSTNKQYKFSHPKIKIIYEDDYLLVINKDTGILSVATPRHEELTAYKVMLNYVKKQNLKNNLFVVHRIDRETSGVLIFAKTPEVQELLKEHWHDDSHQRFYYALTEGEMEKDEDTIISWLTENPKSLKVHSSITDDGGEKAITLYKVICRKDGKSLLKVNIKTGKKNQIRVQLASIGHPIVGDRKYGATTTIGRLGLHAAQLILIHPITGKQMSFDAPIPKVMHLG